MSNGSSGKRIPLGPILLIGLGALFLYAQLHPEFNPWPYVTRFWPLLLILWGVAKLVDYQRARGNPEAPRTSWISGGEIIFLIVVLVLGAATFGRRGHTGFEKNDIHQFESVERGAAESVSVDLTMGAGELAVAGGSAKLLEADFRYNQPELKPKISYDVNGGKGRLKVEEPESGVSFGDVHNVWDLRLNNDLPMEMKIELGAGQSDLRLNNLSLTRLDVEVGAGEVHVDLTGDWKKDMEVNIEGGVGQVTVRVPREVGVRVQASGGIGSIDISDLRKEGDWHVNEAYGKSPVTLRIKIEGGVGEIRVREGP